MLPGTSKLPVLDQSRAENRQGTWAIPSNDDADTQHLNKEAKERLRDLQGSTIPQYPRYQHNERRHTTYQLRKLVESKTKNATGAESTEEDTSVEVSGRITAIRLSGRKLAFIDITEDGWKTQIELNYRLLNPEIVNPPEFREHVRLLRRGDYISVVGRQPFEGHDTITVQALELPTLQVPCLQRLPLAQRGSVTGQAIETNFKPRHVEMLEDPDLITAIKVRSKITRAMREFFTFRSFVEVFTPILSGRAGGAAARPFETNAREFPDRLLSLRIAPELWLKRLIIGGMVRIFEIGSSFRNEGIDLSHNPEFTTCEFYAVSHDLQQLMTMTKELFVNLDFNVYKTYPRAPMNEDNEALSASLKGDWEVVDFIPALNAALGTDLPNLSSPSAYSSLVTIFDERGIPHPSQPTVLRLVDKLCSTYLEPLSAEKPLWITNIPECMSPLAKSFIHPTAPNEQPVAARAELFIQGKEIVNCYEEENSPFEQRRKFIEQQKLAGTHDDEAMKIDEDYLAALEWGLPPTGGWGCGIDRLVMLFTGKERIGDVLSFGTLRAVTRGAERAVVPETNQPAGDEAVASTSLASRIYGNWDA